MMAFQYLWTSYRLMLQEAVDRADIIFLSKKVESFFKHLNSYQARRICIALYNGVYTLFALGVQKWVGYHPSRDTVPT